MGPTCLGTIVYTRITVFSNSKSLICFSEKRKTSVKNFYLRRLLASILLEFGNSSSRLNFITSPPRDIREKVENFYLQMN